MPNQGRAGEDETRDALNLTREDLMTMWEKGRPAKVRRTSPTHPRKRRLYPFTEPVPMTTSSANGTASTITVDMRVTTYKPNPFHGVDRWLFALDEWHHRTTNYAGWSWRRPWRGLWSATWRPFCNWWDRRLIATGESDA